jgi:hypothetical protein
MTNGMTKACATTSARLGIERPSKRVGHEIFDLVLRPQATTGAGGSRNVARPLRWPRCGGFLGTRSCSPWSEAARSIASARSTRSSGSRRLCDLRDPDAAGGETMSANARPHRDENLIRVAVVYLGARRGIDAATSVDEEQQGG